MVVPYVIAGLAGAVLMGRTKPKTRMRAVEVYGPKSGLVYKAERVEGLDVFVFHAPDGTRAIFERLDDGRMQFRRGAGDRTVIATMCSDFDTPDEKKEEKK